MTVPTYPVDVPPARLLPVVKCKGCGTPYWITSCAPGYEVRCCGFRIFPEEADEPEDISKIGEPVNPRDFQQAPVREPDYEAMQAEIERLGELVEAYRSEESYNRNIRKIAAWVCDKDDCGQFYSNMLRIALDDRASHKGPEAPDLTDVARRASEPDTD